MPPSFAATRRRRLLRAVTDRLPRGEALPTADWAWRHAVVCWVLAAHVPLLVAYALLQDRAGEVPQVALPLLAALLVARLPALPAVPRIVRSLASSLGLLMSSALLVHLSGSATEAEFHYFLVVAGVALYQDWAVYALAIGFVALQHGLMVALPGTAETGQWRPALVLAGAVLAESAVLVLFWRANELSRASADRARAALVAGHAVVRAKVAETDQVRADLIGTVSHEFRTPLTGIRGAALTLLKRGDRLDKQGRDQLLHAVLDQQERLSRLLENMLVAAQATAVDPLATAEVDAVAAEVVMLATATRAGGISVVVAPGTVARIDRPALHQVLANLVDNALQHGASGSVPVVAGGADPHGVWVTVSNEGATIDLTAAGRLFEPFTQLDSGATRDREGIGVGLYVVRRLVEVYGGTVQVTSDSGWTTVEVRLQAVTDLQPSLSV